MTHVFSMRYCEIRIVHYIIVIHDTGKREERKKREYRARQESMFASMTRIRFVRCFFILFSK